MAKHRLKSTKLLVKQLTERFFNSTNKELFTEGKKSNPDAGLYYLHYEGKVRDVLLDLLQPFENEKFLSEFILSQKEDHDNINLTICIHVGHVYEVKVWDFDVDDQVRHVAVFSDPSQRDFRLTNYIPQRGE